MSSSGPADQEDLPETGLVRPYVLGTGNDTGQPPRVLAGADQDSGWSQRLLPDEPAKSGRPEGTAALGQGTAPARVGRPGGHGLPESPGRRDLPANATVRNRLAAPARHRRHAAIGAAAGLAVLGVCALIVVAFYPRVPASGCLGGACSPVTAQVPQTASPFTRTSGTHPTALPRVTRHTGTPTGQTPIASVPASASPAPSASASSSPTHSSTPAKPSVTVTYSVTKQWAGGFQGQFTIVNHGTTAVSGWELSAVLPGDRVSRVWDATYHMAGDTLIMDPPSYQVTIPSGDSLAESFVARGTTTRPEGCTFNGIAC